MILTALTTVVKSLVMSVKVNNTYVNNKQVVFYTCT